MRRFLLTLLLLFPLTAQAQLAPAVQASVNAACGNCTVGVSIGSPTDQTTWRLSFAPGASATQQQQAQAALTAFPLATWNAQQAAQATAQATLAAGLTVKSTAYPALDGTYSVTPAATGNISSVMLYIQVHQTFPGGASTMPWLDAAGTPHVFPSTTEFEAFATDAADFVAAVSLGQSYALPAAIP